MTTINNFKKPSIVGIDLGTTNSVVAIYDSGTPKVIPNSYGNYLTPSIVAYSKMIDNGATPIIGNYAKRQTVMNPENTFYSVKRLIGCNFDEIKNEITRLSYQVKKDETGKIKLVCPLLKKEFSPEEISAIILKTLAKDASTFLNTEIKEAVITVPAYFNDSQRLATKDAGTIAGLNVLRILNEPTAAALAYGLEKKKNETILIFDLGGGTFDVSILEVGEDIFEVLSTAGDTHLGGDDFDNVIVDYIVQKFKEDYNVNLYQDKQAIQRILEASENAKIALSSNQSTSINLPFLSLVNGEIKSFEMKLDRSKFEELSYELIQRCKEPVIKAMNDAKLTKSEINEVVLVGGSTRIPAVKNLLKDLIGKTLNETVNPDEVVALGAAIQAGILAGEVRNLILLDVTPLSLGIETLNGLMTTIIARNTSIPIRKTEVFSTAEDYQTEVEVHILQGDRALAKDNKSLGIFTLSGIEKAPRGIPKINVTFELNSDGLLEVNAKDVKSGKEQSIKIEGASTLNREEVEQMLKDAEKYVNTDKVLRIISSLTYEMDLVLEAFDLIKEKYSISSKNIISLKYFNLLIEKLKTFYLEKNSDILKEIFFKELFFVYNVLLQETIKNIKF